MVTRGRGIPPLLRWLRRSFEVPNSLSCDQEQGGGGDYLESGMHGEGMRLVQEMLSR